MKSFIVLFALAVLAISQASVVKAPASRANLNLGYVSTGDRLLSRQNLRQPAIANAIQYQNMVYNGSRTTRITAIHAFEIGYTQYAYPSVIAGGINANNCTVRIQSARGYGFNYQIEIWGR